MTIEEIFGLGTIGTTDRRAAPTFDAFDFKQPPRPFRKIQAEFPERHFLDEKPSNLDLDD